MTQPSWPSWLHSSPPSHSTHLEGRVVRLEVHKEQQEDTNAQVRDRMLWLERGLQAIAGILLLLLTKQAPSSAGAVADILLGIIKR